MDGIIIGLGYLTASLILICLYKISLKKGNIPIYFTHFDVIDQNVVEFYKEEILVKGMEVEAKKKDRNVYKGRVPQ